VNHLNFLKIALLTILCTFLGDATFCQNMDVVYSESMHITLSEHHKGYTLENNVSESFKLLSEAATKQKTYTIYGKYYAPVSKIRAEIDHKSISDDYISSRVASDPDVFISDEIQHTIYIASPPAVGSTFSCSYREEYSDASFFPLVSVPNADSVARFTMTIEHPENVHVEFHYFFPFDSIPCSVARPDKETTILTVGGVGPQHHLNYYPYASTRALILTSLVKDSVEINPTSIREFTVWYGRKTDLHPKLDSANAAFLADSLRHCRTPPEKLKVLYDYVRSSIRYVADERGINGIVPRPPSLVLEHQYGDCKDRASLLCALAREAGIPLSMAVIASSPAPFDSLIHPSLFNHMICAYAGTAGTMFLDPTARYCEFGNLPAAYQQTRAFILDPEYPRYEWVRRIDSQPSIDIAVECSPDSLTAGTATIVLRNDVRWMALHALRDMTHDELKRFLQKKIGSHFAQLQLDDFAVVSEDSDALVVRSRADLSSFIISSTGREYVPKMPFVAIAADVLDRKSDAFPVWIEEPISIRCRISMKAPGWTTIPDTLEIGGLSGKDSCISSSLQQHDNLLFTYAYAQTGRMYKGISRDAFFSFYEGLSQQRKSVFTISRK